MADNMTDTLDAALIPMILKECTDHDLDFDKVMQDVIKPEIPITLKVALYGDETGWPADRVEAARSVYRGD